MPNHLGIVAASIALAAPLTVRAAPPNSALDPLEQCMIFGTVVPQPPGSPIAACCTEDGCIICNPDWTGCEVDPPYGAQGGLPGQDGAVVPPPQSGAQGAFAPLQLRVQ